MAVPVWQSRTTLTGAAGTTAVVTYPASIAAGDIILTVIYKENTNAITPPAGHVAVHSAVTTTAPQHHQTFWFRAAGGESGTVSFSWTGSVFRAATMHRITGCVATGDPFETPGTASSNASVSTLNVSVAGSAADGLWFWAGTDFTGGNTWTPPGTYTERSDIDLIGDATKDNAAGGASGTITGTANVSGPMTAVLFNLLSGAAATGGVQSARGGKTWRRRFKHRQRLALEPVVSANATNAPAECATATGTADNPSASIAPGPSTATATGTANNPNPSVKPGPTAAVATGAANNTTSLVSPTPATATATGAAQDPSRSILVNPTTATATGVANNATVSTGSATNAPAGLASATGTANNPNPSVAPSPATATATGTANNTTSKVATGPTTGTAAGVANNATVTTGSATNATAGVATATGVANNTTSKIASGPQTATALGVVSAASLSIRASAQASAALGSAFGPGISGLILIPGTANAGSMTVPTAGPGAPGIPVANPAAVLVPTGQGATGTAPTGNAATSTVPTATGG